MDGGAKISPQFHALAKAGYARDLLPIMPPNLPAPEHARSDGTVVSAHPDWEKLPPHRRLSPSAKALVLKADPHTRTASGKIPGKLLIDGWCGFTGWSQYEATNADFVEWSSWEGVGIGLNTRDYAAFDIDVTAAALSNEIAELLHNVIGPAPQRIGNAPKQLRLYHAAEPASKRTLRITLDGKTHLVEVLGRGQQFVVAGMHPSGKPYTWPEGDLANGEAALLTVASREQIEEALAKIEAHVAAHGGTVERSGSDPDAPHSPPTGKPIRSTMDENRAAAIAIARVLDPGAPYPQWRDRIWRFKAIPPTSGEDPAAHDVWTTQLVQDWSAGLYSPDGNAPSKYTGPDAADAVIETNRAELGNDVRALINDAMANGFDPGGERTDERSRQTAKAAFAERIKEEQQKAAEEAEDEPEDEPGEAEESWPELVRRFRGVTPQEGANLPPIQFLDAEKTLPLTKDGAVIEWYGTRSTAKTSTATCKFVGFIKAHLDNPEHAPPVRVAYCVGEGVHGFVRQTVPAVAAHHGVPLDALGAAWRTVPVPTLTATREVKAFCYALAGLFEGKPPTVLIIDTLATASGAAEENSDAIGKLFLSTGPVGRIKRKLGGPLVVVIAHAGKEKGRGARGHSSQEGNVDGLVRFEFDKDARVLTQFVEKMRNAEDGYALEYRVSAPGSVPLVTLIGRVKPQLGGKGSAPGFAGAVEAALEKLAEHGETAVSRGRLGEAIVRTAKALGQDTAVDWDAPLSEADHTTIAQYITRLERAAKPSGEPSSLTPYFTRTGRKITWSLPARGNEVRGK